MAVCRLWPLRILLVGTRAGLCDGAIRWLHSKWGGADFIVADPNYVAHLPVGLTLRRGAVDLRRHHVLQRFEKDPGQARAVGGGFQRGRTRPSRGAVCQSDGPVGVRC